MISHAIRFAGTQAAGFLVVLFAVSVTSVSTAGTASSFDDYRLTDAALNGYERATEIMYQYAVDHPEAMAAMEEDESDDGDFDIGQMTAQIDARAPGLRKAMEKSGLSLEEYFTFSVVMAVNAFGVAMADEFGGADEAKLSDLQRANMAFIRKHQQRLEAFGERMSEKYGPLTDGADEDAYDSEGDESYDEEYSEDEYAEDE
jgi:hypothetical protein